MKSKKESHGVELISYDVELDQWKKLQELLNELIENLEKLNSFKPFDNKEGKEKLS